MFLANLQVMAGGEGRGDAALMTGLARQEQKALEELYDRYAKRVYSLVLRTVREVATAEELVQDVFLQLWRNAHRFEGARGSLCGWLMTLARNRALDYLRGRQGKQRQREEELAPEAVGAPGPDPAGAIDQARQAARVKALMESLPELQRRAIELAYFEGMTHSEIAETLKQPLGTVKSWIRGGLLRLKESLSEGS